MALAATDAVPGDPFKLGQDNRIAAATTTLSGADQGLDSKFRANIICMDSAAPFRGS